jgi:hypothetical protein
VAIFSPPDPEGGGPIWTTGAVEGGRPFRRRVRNPDPGSGTLQLVSLSSGEIGGIYHRFHGSIIQPARQRRLIDPLAVRRGKGWGAQKLV